MICMSYNYGARECYKYRRQIISHEQLHAKSPLPPHRLSAAQTGINSLINLNSNDGAATTCAMSDDSTKSILTQLRLHLKYVVLHGG